MSSSASGQKNQSQKHNKNKRPRAGDGSSFSAAGGGRCAHRRCRRAVANPAAPSSSPLLFLLLLSSLSFSLLASAQQVDPALIESIGAATLSGEGSSTTNVVQAGDTFAFSTTNSTTNNGTDPSATTLDPAVAATLKDNLSDEEKQAKLDRVLSFLSAGNIFVGNYEPYQRVIRRRVEEWVECRYNGTLTSRGVGIEETLPDVARLAFAFLGDTKEEVADAALTAYARINSEIADAGFVGLAAALESASSDVSLSPIKFVLPQDAGEGDSPGKDSGNESSGDSSSGAPSTTAANNSSTSGEEAAAGGADGNPETPNPQFLVEVRVVLRSQDAPHLELGSSAALEAAVLAGGERFAASSSVFELSPLRLSQIFNAARVKANEDMLYALIADAAQLGVLLGPLDEYAPERRQQVTSAPDADAFDSLAAAGGGRPSRLFAVVEVAASYQVCSGGLQSRRGFVRIDEDGFDLGDLTTDSSSGN